VQSYESTPTSAPTGIKTLTVNLHLKARNSDLQMVKASGVKCLHIPHSEEWGPSSSINKIVGPKEQNGSELLDIEMQSGNVM
jgi:hypothetical protein